jgi:hypothetical protein
MPVRSLNENTGNGYLADDAGALIECFEGALNELRITDRTDPAAVAIAKHIVEQAKAGERDPVRLRELALEAARHSAARRLNGRP